MHPEPGSPHHFKWNPTAPLPAHQWDYLTAYRADFRFPTYTNGQGLSNLYYLADVFDNSTYGHTATSATSPAGNVQVAFAAQQASDDPTEGPSAYRLTINWNNSPQWPNGPYISTLTVTGSDIETGPFSVSQNYTAVFSQPEFYSLVWVDAYEQPYDLKFDFSVNPPVPITFVSPGAARTRLNGELSRNSILLVTGTRLSWTSQTPEGWISFEGSPGDPKIVTDGVDSFDVSLVDDKGDPVTDGTIKVSLCPVLDHRAGQPTSGQIDTRPCPEEQVSPGGVLQGVRPIDRGYMGLMVTEAPAAPGVYFFRIRSLPSNVHEWRVGGSLDPQNNYTYTYAVTVLGGEILDNNFRRADPLVVEQPTQAYLRVIAHGETANAFSLTVTTFDSRHQPVSADVPVTVTRLGQSSTFLGPIVFEHKGWMAAKGLGQHAVLSGPTLIGDFVRDLVEGLKGGKQAVGGKLAVPAQLQIEWLDENDQPSPDQQVTRVVLVDSEARPGRPLYAEETRLRIVATDSQGEVASNVDGVVRLDEAPNEIFPAASFFTTTPDWRFSYQAEFDVATDLRPSRPRPGDFTAVPLTAGATGTIRLLSLAGPRMATEIGGDIYSRDFNASVHICGAEPRLPCAIDSPATTSFKPRGESVKQWVDQLTYSRAPSEPAVDANQIRDWIEAMSWDAMSVETGQGGLFTAASLSVSGFAEVPSSVFDENQFAETSNSRVIRWFPQNFSRDANRWDSARCAYEFGFQMSELAAFTAVALHESRHAWQWKLLQDDLSQDQADLDSMPASPESVDPLAVRTKDSHQQAVNGGNPESHLAGPQVFDPEGQISDMFLIQRERDADFFEKRATESSWPPTVISSSLQSAVLLSSPSLSRPAGSPPLPNAISVKVLGHVGACDGDTNLRSSRLRNVGIEGIIVVASFPVSSGIAVFPTNTSSGSRSVTGASAVAVAETDGNGIATMSVQGITPGDYAVTVSVYHLEPAGDRLGPALGQFIIPVQVTP